MKYLFSVLIAIVCSYNLSAQQKFEVYFDFGKHVPNAASSKSLEKWITENRNAEVLKVSGYADSVDANDYNKKLSLQRIQTVVEQLKANRIRINENVVLQPFGEDFSISADQSKNRKVTIAYRDQTQKELEPFTVSDTVYDDIPHVFKNKKPGDIIRLRNIHFVRNKEEVIPESVPVLEQLYAVLAANPRLTIEIHGHICCNPNVYDTKLSYRRAKYIFTYLLEKGIPLNQLAYKGFGSAYPVYPIPEQTHAQQVANRRVEILIVRL